MKNRLGLLKSLSVIALVLVICSGVISADTSKVLTLTLEEAIDLALENNIDYQIELLTWENTQIDEKIRALRPLETEEEKLQFKLLTRTNEENLNRAYVSAIVNTIRDYFNLQKLGRLVEIAENNQAVAQNSYQLVKRRVELGELPERDLLREEKSYEASQAALASAQRTYQNALNDFLFVLGVIGNYDKAVLPSEVPVVTFDLELNDTLRLAKENNLGIWQQSINYRLAEINFEKIKAQNPAPLELQKAENNFAVTVLNQLKVERNVERQFVDRWYSMQDSKRSLESANLNLRFAEEDYQRSIKQHEIGLITETQLTQSKNSYLNTVNQTMDTRVSFLTSVIQFRSDLGLSVWPL
ncbi:MAG: TolC family protein [Firmicutes bacterium]|nr:TolC family protein [Bacillota bacterium]